LIKQQNKQYSTRKQDRRAETFTEAILVTGTPGTGKTTVAKKLAAKLGAKYIGITELIKKEQLFISEDKERNTLVADTEEVEKHLQKILEETEGKTVIDGHYAVDVTPKNYVSMVFVLRRDPRQLKTTLESRGYDSRKVWENLTAEILDVCLWDTLSVIDSDRVCEIDVTDKTIDDVVNYATSALEKKENCRQGIVDWLKTLEKAGQLEEFMRKMG
jgi:adenylate kinase